MARRSTSGGCIGGILLMMGVLTIICVIIYLGLAVAIVCAVASITYGIIKLVKKKREKTEEIVIDEEEPNIQSINRIDMYNNKIDYMTGEDFELYVAQMLGKIGFYNIQTTKGSGDQGVDILAEKEGMKYAFQCKRYDKPVGNKAVQEVFAGKFFYHCHVAVVVTNNYFTQSAKDLAHENGVVLWDRNYLQKFIGTTNKFSIEKSKDSIVERHYYINGDFAEFSLKKENKIEILAVCENSINAANLYLSYSVKLKEEWIGKIDFAVAVNFGNAVAICTNENGVEFFGGKEFDGEIAIGIPKWMDKARDDLLNGNQEEFLRMIEEANGYLNEFMTEVIKYIK